MPEITDAQREAFRKHISELYPGDKLQELNADPSLRGWWSAIADDNRTQMLEIDRDQISSASSLPTLWVKRR